MADAVNRPRRVVSPCVRICVVHPEARICVGCLRRIDEIARWSAMDDAERSAVLDELPGRAALIRVRRGGRSGRHRRAGG